MRTSNLRLLECEKVGRSFSIQIVKEVIGVRLPRRGPEVQVGRKRIGCATILKR
jgi:hypothetical protein